MKLNLLNLFLTGLFVMLTITNTMGVATGEDMNWLRIYGFVTSPIFAVVFFGLWLIKLAEAHAEYTAKLIAGERVDA